VFARRAFGGGAEVAAGSCGWRLSAIFHGPPPRSASKLGTVTFWLYRDRMLCFWCRVVLRLHPDWFSAARMVDLSEDFKLYQQEVPVKGRAVFAGTPIPAGRLVLKFEGPVFTKETCPDFSEAIQVRIETQAQPHCYDSKACWCGPSVECSCTARMAVPERLSVARVRGQRSPLCWSRIPGRFPCADWRQRLDVELRRPR
jgi:hypothetical protein